LQSGEGKWVVVLNCLEILLAQTCHSLASGCIRFGFR